MVRSYLHGTQKDDSDIDLLVDLETGRGLFDLVALKRDVEVIVEATKELSKETRRQRQNIPWDDMAGMRDVLIHHYMGVDLGIVRDVSQNTLEDLRSQEEFS